MQAAIILALMILAPIFMAIEFSRNDSTNTANLRSFKASSVAANIVQYNDLMVQYMLVNYDKLHPTLSIKPGNVEQITSLNYTEDHINSYSQKNLLLFLNYATTAFNYAKAVDGESEIIPILYLATSWNRYTNDVIPGYSTTLMPDVLGQLGQDISKHIYQGNSTYWIVPWVFSQNNCKITEIFAQLPDDGSGMTSATKLYELFNLFCTQIQAGSNYKFLKYVYLQPVIKSSNI